MEIQIFKDSPTVESLEHNTVCSGEEYGGTLNYCSNRSSDDRRQFEHVLMR